MADNLIKTRSPERLGSLRDELLPYYDGLFGPGSPGFERAGARLLTEAQNKFGPGSWIVHIGCGTGHDTLALAKQGVRVWATDWSPKMVEATVARAEAAKLGHLVTGVVLSPRDLKQLLGRELTQERLDGAYAPWGALNLEEDLPALFDGLYTLIRPGGLVIAGMLGGRSIFGAAGEAARGNLKAGFARLRGKGPESGEWHLGGSAPALPVAYPSYQEIQGIYGTRFNLEKREPLGLLTRPRVDGAKRSGGVKRLIPRLGRLEKALAPLPIAQAMADQNLLVIRRTIEGVWGPAGPHFLAN